MPRKNVKRIENLPKVPKKGGGLPSSKQAGPAGKVPDLRDIVPMKAVLP